MSQHCEDCDPSFDCWNSRVLCRKQPQLKTYSKEQILNNVPDSKMSQWVSLEDHQRAIEAAYKDAAFTVQMNGVGIAVIFEGTANEFKCYKYRGDQVKAILARLEQIKKGV